MEIEKSLLGPEINAIVSNTKANATNKTNHEVTIHTVDHDIIITKLITVEAKEDYNDNYSTEIYVELMCPMGDFVKFVYPFRNNLEMSIIKNTNGYKELERYKLILLNINENYGSGKYKEMSLEELNKNEAKNLRCQCVERSVEAMRLKTVEGVYRDHTLTDIMCALFHIELNKVKVNGVGIDPLINMVKADNQRVYNHVIIPSGTKIVDLPVFLQEKDYGIYNGHIGFYIKTYKEGTYFNTQSAEKKLNLFVYPLYNTELTASVAKHKLIIYNVPNFKYSMVENTYLIDDQDIKIIASEDSRKSNKGDDSFMDNGVGFVSLDAKTVMRRPFEINETGVTSSKTNANTDIYMKERSDGSMYRGYQKPTDNLYHLRSNYLKDNGDMLQVKWNFSNTKYLLPGMAVVYVYLGDNNNVVRLNGVLQSHYTVNDESKSMCNSILNIFIEKDKHENS